MQSLNPGVIPKANGNTDLAKVAIVVRKARAQNGRTAIRNWMMPPPHRERRRVVSQNAKKPILTANRNESDGNPELAATTVTRTRRETGQEKGRNGPNQDRKSRKAESNLRSLPPLRPTLVPTPMHILSVDGPEVFPQSQD